ncbi:unnamed protein product [Lupinus luteus]|uniref:Uncharacterized protein n=1 Tax=Lupinus luteus TaxID=3873 RepID=A0AAV1WNH3_LUPLU
MMVFFPIGNVDLHCPPLAPTIDKGKYPRLPNRVIDGFSVDPCLEDLSWMSIRGFVDRGQLFFEKTNETIIELPFQGQGKYVLGDFVDEVVSAKRSVAHVQVELKSLAQENMVCAWEDFVDEFLPTKGRMAHTQDGLKSPSKGNMICALGDIVDEDLLDNT